MSQINAHVPLDVLNKAHKPGSIQYTEIKSGFQLVVTAASGRFVGHIWIPNGHPWFNLKPCNLDSLEGRVRYSGSVRDNEPRFWLFSTFPYETCSQTRLVLENIATEAERVRDTKSMKLVYPGGILAAPMAEEVSTPDEVQQLRESASEDRRVAVIQLAESLRDHAQNAAQDMQILANRIQRVIDQFKEQQ